MEFAQEGYDDVIDEIKPLLQAHYDEIAMHKDIALQPQWDEYKKLFEQEKLVMFTCRDDGQLVGYSIYLLSYHLHYASCFVAYQDILFIRRDKRGNGLKFILWCDEQLKKKYGVDMTVQHVKSANNFGPALEKIGYNLMDLIYTRRL